VPKRTLYFSKYKFLNNSSFFHKVSIVPGGSGNLITILPNSFNLASFTSSFRILTIQILYYFIFDLNTVDFIPS
jgi:hypothetical protein